MFLNKKIKPKIMFDKSSISENKIKKFQNNLEIVKSYNYETFDTKMT